MSTLRDAIAHIRPAAEFITKNNEEIIWLDQKQQQPNESEIADAFQLLDQEKKQKEAARQDLLNRLGITEEEARLLLGGN